MFSSLKPAGRPKRLVALGVCLAVFLVGLALLAAFEAMNASAMRAC